MQFLQDEEQISLLVMYFEHKYDRFDGVMYCQDVHFVFKLIHPPFIMHTYQVLLAFDSAFIMEISASWSPRLGLR